MKTLLFILVAIPLLIFATGSQSFSACKGDFDCNGVVDGLDLADFADSFGQTDCSSDISKVIGTISFADRGEVDLRSLQLTLYQVGDVIGGPSAAKAEFDAIKVLIAADGQLTPQLNLITASAEVLPEVIIIYSKYELLKLQNVIISSINYLPPLASGAPFLLDISLTFSKIVFSWAGQHVDWDLALNKGSGCTHADLRFINLIDYAGSNVFPDYIPISAYSFSMAHHYDPHSASRAEFEAIEIKSAVSDVSLCLFSMTASGTHINEVMIEKWGAAFRKDPEVRIELEDVIATIFSIYSNSAGDLEQKTAFSYGRIRWSHWAGPDPKNPVKWTTGWDLVNNEPL